MEKKIIKSIKLNFAKEEVKSMDKAQEIIDSILEVMELHNCNMLILEYYESMVQYSQKDLEKFSELLEYLPCSDNEVIEL